MVVRRVALWSSLLLALLWTNPSLNADGTPCTDLSLIRFWFRHEASGQVYTADFPLWWDDPETSERVWRSHEGLPDTLSNVTLPPAPHPYDWWWVRAYAVDFSGNVSDSSNTISVTAPTTGE